MADVTTPTLEAYRDDAATRFSTAQDSLDNPPTFPQVTPPPPPPPPDTREKFIKRNQDLLNAALAQLSNAETMLSAQQGRVGYAEVVKLMTATATAADAICDRLASLAQSLVPMPSPPVQPPLPTLPAGTTTQEKLQMMATLTEALKALAQLSPASVWQKGSTPGA